MIHVAAPERMQRRLSRAADGPRAVLHRGTHALYVDLDGACLGLVSAAATQVPCALWSRLPDLDRVHGSGEVWVEGGTLRLSGIPVRVGRVVDVRVPGLSPARVAAAVSAGVSTGVSAGVSTRRTPAPEEAGPMTPARAAALMGRGPGLTPYGDDVLAGWLVTRAAAGRPDPAVTTAVLDRLDRTTALSATLLECAVRGEAVPEMRAWLAAVGTDDEERTTNDLVGVGASSGAGMLAGARGALHSLHPRAADRPAALRRIA